MSSTLNVTLPQGASPKINLDKGLAGRIAYTVTNTKTVQVRVSARAEAIDPAQQSWVSLETSQTEWDLKPNESIQITVAVNVNPRPPQAMECSCRLVVANAANPDSDFTQG